MQVNNNTQQCSFGMALKIRPSVRKAIRAKSPALSETLNKAEEIVKDTKYYDLIIEDNGISRIKSADDEFFGVSNITEPFNNGKFFFVDTFTHGHPCSRCVICLNSEAAQKAYEKLSKAAEGYERDAVLTKILDDSKQQALSSGLIEH